MKAALLSSLAYRQKLLVLDEPFAGLDALVRDEFIQGILELAEEAKWSVFISSHDIDEVERLADWIGGINEGRLYLSEPVASLVSTLPAGRGDVRGRDAGGPPELPRELALAGGRGPHVSRDRSEGRRTWRGGTGAGGAARRHAGGSVADAVEGDLHDARAHLPLCQPRGGRPMIADALHIAWKDLRQHRLWSAAYLAVVAMRAVLVGSGIDAVIRDQRGLASLGMAYMVPASCNWRCW